MPTQQNPAIEKLRATLQVAESISNCRRLLARFAGAVTQGIPSQGVTAQEVINLVGRDEANLVIAANAVFVASETPAETPAEPAAEPAA